MRRTALAAGALGLAHALPSATSLPVVRRRFPTIWGQGRADHVALTFDDGPDPESTPQLMEVLADLDVRATFFVLGEQVAAAPDLASELVSAGHELGLHGWHHRNSLRVAPRAVRDALGRAYRVVAEAVDTPLTFYRPPYGIATTGTLLAARSLGLRTVLWRAWGEDWAPTATPASVLRTLAPDLHGGATVLLHDSDVTSSPGSWRATLGALRPLVEGLRARGLRVGPLREHGLAGAGPA